MGAPSPDGDAARTIVRLGALVCATPNSAWAGWRAFRISREVDVRFRRSGRTLLWNGQHASLLDFAERHGIDVESGCRAGSRGGCETH